MKKILIIFLTTALIFAMTGFSGDIPNDVKYGNWDDCKVIVKVFELPEYADPGLLIEEPFELMGYSYSFLDMTKAEKKFENSLKHKEIIVVHTESSELEDIIKILKPTINYEKDGYSGVLKLDEGSIVIREADGYNPVSSAGRDMEITLLMADPSFGEEQAEELSGYVSTATYSGEIKANLTVIDYTLTYLGEPVQPTVDDEQDAADKADSSIDEEQGEKALQNQERLLYILGGALIILIIAVVFRLSGKNVFIYTLAEDGIQYDLIGKQKLSARTLSVDLNRLDIPEGMAVIEIRGKIVRDIFGRFITVWIDGKELKHLVEQPSDGSYWFSIGTENNEAEL